MMVIPVNKLNCYKQDKREMASDLARMVQDCVAALPAGADVKFLAPAGGQDLIHERFISRQDKSISKLLMGHNNGNGRTQ